MRAPPAEPTGRLSIELGGTDPASFDRITVGETADLGGILSVSLIGGFLPSVGDSFELLTASGITREFSDLVLPDISSIGEWDLSIGPSTSSGLFAVSLAVTPEPGSAPLLVLAGIGVAWRLRSQACRGHT